MEPRAKLWVKNEAAGGSEGALVLPVPLARKACEGLGVCWDWFPRGKSRAEVEEPRVTVMVDEDVVGSQVTGATPLFSR